MRSSKRILPIIVISQFCCTSLWFAGNGVMSELIRHFELADSALAHLTSAVQFGFITGTFIFALLTIADRFSPSRVFFFSAIAGAVFNLGVIIEGNSLYSLLSLRFLTGFFLAGIYPVGMKIAADYFQAGLGKSLGFLVGALVVGTAFPHLLRGFFDSYDWRFVIVLTSVLAAIGGLLIAALVPDGPHRRQSQKLKLNEFLKVFKNKSFRSAAFGYFGHMWELYAFWAFVPVMLAAHVKLNPDVSLNIPVLSFFIIGLGGVACVIGGYLSIPFGAKRIAFISLLLSCLCCLVSPLFFHSHSSILLIVFLLFWGLVVIADSPLFSTLVANNASPEVKGTALTIVNCIGFSITIVSIQVINWLGTFMNSNYSYMVLSIGPILGLIALSRRNKKENADAVI